MKRFIQISSILIGAMILAQWGISIASGKVPELETEPFAITFHLIAEIIMALVLILSGILTGVKGTAKYGMLLALFGNGMVGYSIINSSGYFVETGQYLLLIPFIFVGASAALNTIFILKELPFMKHLHSRSNS